MSEIHPSAVIHPTAQLGAGVCVGPYCLIGPEVVIGDDCLLKSHVVIERGVRMGCDNRVYAHVVLGEEPQIHGLHNPDSQLLIGDHNVFREHVTISRGSPRGDNKTVVGSHNLFMIGSHLGHDAVVEDHVTLGNYVQIAGHGKIERNVLMSAFSAIHQFVTVGRHVFTGGNTGAQRDLPPFTRVSGMYHTEVHGINVVGLQRSGFSSEHIAALHEAHRKLYRRRSGAVFAAILEELSQEAGLDEHVRYLVEFLQRSSRHRFGRYQETLRH